jgi:hypothetical protein
MKHSPAPWTEYEDDDGNVLVKMDNAHEVLIANLEGSCGTCHANARLIQLAPEILELLEQIIDCPYSIDQATVPYAGMDARREQVVFQYSISYARIYQARELIKNIKGLDDSLQNHDYSRLP